MGPLRSSPAVLPPVGASSCTARNVRCVDGVTAAQFLPQRRLQRQGQLRRLHILYCTLLGPERAFTGGDRSDKIITELKLGGQPSWHRLPPLAFLHEPAERVVVVLD
jgi:hypothetical protein